MMIDPPIDKLMEVKDCSCKYTLACVVVKRARQLIGQEEEYLNETGLKAITLAAKELYEGKIIVSRD